MSLSVKIANVFIQLWSKECKIVHSILKYLRSWGCSSFQHSFLSLNVIPLVKPFLSTQTSPSSPSPTTFFIFYFINWNFLIFLTHVFSVFLCSTVCSVRSNPMFMKCPYSCILAIPISFFFFKTFSILMVKNWSFLKFCFF